MKLFKKTSLLCLIMLLSISLIISTFEKVEAKKHMKKRALTNTLKSKLRSRKSKSRSKSKSKWASAGTHWGSSDRDPPGEVLAPFNNAGPDKFGVPINNNYWRGSDLNPLNQSNGSPMVIGNKSYLTYKHKQPDDDKKKNTNYYNYTKENEDMKVRETKNGMTWGWSSNGKEKNESGGMAGGLATEIRGGSLGPSGNFTGKGNKMIGGLGKIGGAPL